jgi:hypothetical protein
MNKVEKLTLIEGEFSDEEAKEILTNIFSSKINFHNIKNWSSNERFGMNDEIAQKRVPELRKEMVKLQEILSDAKAKKRRLIITSEINITLLDA